MTVWHPDTCSRPACQIEVSDGPPEYEEPAGTILRHLSVCAAHVEAEMDHNAVLAENRHKNKIVNAMLDSGDLTRNDVLFSYGPGRSLTFTVSPAKASSVARLQAIADGIGQARIVAAPKP